MASRGSSKARSSAAALEQHCSSKAHLLMRCARLLQKQVKIRFVFNIRPSEPLASLAIVHMSHSSHTFEFQWREVLWLLSSVIALPAAGVLSRCRLRFSSALKATISLPTATRCRLDALTIYIVLAGSTGIIAPRRRTARCGSCSKPAAAAPCVCGKRLALLCFALIGLLPQCDAAKCNSANCSPAGVRAQLNCKAF